MAYMSQRYQKPIDEVGSNLSKYTADYATVGADSPTIWTSTSKRKKEIQDEQAKEKITVDGHKPLSVVRICALLCPHSNSQQRRRFNGVSEGYSAAKLKAQPCLDIADQLLSALEVKSGMQKDGKPVQLRGQRAKDAFASYEQRSGQADS